MARAAGADETVPADGFLARVKELTGGRGVDLVVDPVGGDRFTDSLRSLAPEGRLLVIGFTGGEIPTVKVNRLLLNNIAVVGVGWGAFGSRAPGYLQEQWAELLPLLEDGRLDPVLGRRTRWRRPPRRCATSTSAAQPARSCSPSADRGPVDLAVLVEVQGGELAGADLAVDAERDLQLLGAPLHDVEQQLGDLLAREVPLDLGAAARRSPSGR